MALSLHDVVARGDINALRASYNEEMNLSQCDSENRTVLDIAATLGRLECLNELITLGAQVDRCTDSGYTAVHRAAVWGHLDCVKALVQAGADIQKRTRHNERARDAAARYGHAKCVAYLEKIEARNALKADIEEIRSVITDADRIAGKWGKEDKSKATAVCNEKATWLDMNPDTSPHAVYEQKHQLNAFIQPLMTKLDQPE